MGQDQEAEGGEMSVVVDKPRGNRARMPRTGIRLIYDFHGH